MDFGILITALTFGAITSFHCAGMCGPIAVALPLKNETIVSRFLSTILYNLGKALTYGFLGAIFGLFGQGLAIGGLQQWVSIIMGSVMVISILFPALFKNRFEVERFSFRFVGKLKVKLGSLFTKKTYTALFLIGILNGLLPCGPVYAALAGSIATGNIITGALFMFAFGIGTMPMLITISIVGNVISLNLRKRIAKLIPVTVVLIGLLFILRGMGLGIPYISPTEKKLHIPQKKEMKSCEKHCCG